VRFILRGLAESVQGNEEEQKMYEEVVEMSVKELTDILDKDRRLFGFQTYLYYGNK